MGSLDPLAAFALQAVANAQASIDEAILNLGTLVESIRAQVSVGEILNATVLPPENGSDRLQLLGQTVSAQLPPGIFPGENVALQVTGFTPNAVLVRNLGTSLPAQSPSPPQPAVPSGQMPPPAAAAPSAPGVQRPGAQLPPSQPASTSPAPAQPSPGSAPGRSTSVPVPSGTQTPAPPSVAPPREIFVAASVRDAEGLPPAALGDQPAPTPELEARIAAMRAAPPLGKPAPPAPSGVPARATPNLPQRGAPPVPPLNPGDVALAVQRATIERSALSRTAIPNDALPQPSASAPVASARPTPEAALLARLGVPVSATTLAAARIVENATQSLTSAFEKLDAILARQAPNETLVSLRSLLSFVGRLDLRNTTALPEQIAAYVSNVVTGAESKLAQIVRAWSASADLNGGTSLPFAEQASQTAEAPAALAARAAERGIALQHDVKTALLALSANPPQGSPPQVAAALRDALSATTAVQLNALQQQMNEPNAITIALPAYYHQNGAPARLRIAKDAPDGKNRLDADNFHIAFVLDTASLGTVAIDLQTAGRSVSVDVKTETPRAADRFRSSLGDLRGRLEDLHYRVASIGAAIAPRGTGALAPAPAPTAKRSDSNVDAQA